MRNKLAIAVIVFIVWAAITIIGPKMQFGGQEIQLDELVSRTVALNLVVAALFLLAATFYLGWRREVGLKPADPPKSWLLIWFPMLLIALIFAGAVALGLPPSSVVFFVLVNTLIVGLSEELMMRGIFFHGTLSRFSIWQTVLIVSAVFGGIHALNGFLTGDFGSALMQAVAAGMSGVMFIALRLRTNSLYPPILVHGLWDFAVFILMVALTALRTDAPAPEPTMVQRIVMPLMIALPGFLYGLWLLRGIGRRDKEEFLT